MTIIIKPALDKNDHARCIQIRTTVFVHGQSVPAHREVNDTENDAQHFLAWLEGNAVGTIRWRIKKEDAKTAKIERLAVLDSYRGMGVGKKLIRHVINDIKNHGQVKTIILSGQNQAMPFYQSFDFVPYGDEYIDGGTIPHHDMVLEI